MCDTSAGSSTGHTGRDLIDRHSRPSPPFELYTCELSLIVIPGSSSTGCCVLGNKRVSCVFCFGVTAIFLLFATFASYLRSAVATTAHTGEIKDARAIQRSVDFFGWVGVCISYLKCDSLMLSLFLEKYALLHPVKL